MCPMRGAKRMERYAGTVYLRDLPASDVGDGGDRFRRHAKTFEVVVSRDVVRDQPKDRRKRDRLAESLGVGELSDGLDLAS